jgi:hypothetical protein
MLCAFKFLITVYVADGETAGGVKVVRWAVNPA